MAKIYYNDNGTWKVVDISGGGGGGGSSNVVESPLTIGTGIQTLKLHKAGYIEYTNPNQHMKFNLPLYSAQGTVDLLSSESVKTLFGNQSIVGAGNIDLYRHNICFTSTSSDLTVKIRFIVISSKNVVVDSLADLKTLLGNTFTYPVNGANATNSQCIYEITETGFKSGATPYVLYDTVTPYPAGTWTDTVTTI